MRLLPPAAIALLLAPLSNAQAFETDQLSWRHLDAPDSSSVVNEYVNRFLETCRERTNNKLRASTTDSEIARSFRKCVAKENPFSFHYFGARIEVWMRTELVKLGYAVGPWNDGDQRLIYDRFREMYRNGRHAHPAPLVFDLALLISGEIASPTFIAGDVRFGADKLSHFFRLGYKYWKKSDEGRDLSAGIRTGTRSEKMWLGRAGIGIFSYADLAANYSGFTFYRDLIASVDDPVWAERRPHFAISRPSPGGKSQIQTVRPFSLLEYATEDWDEYLNPSVYVSALQTAVTHHLQRNRSLICSEYTLWKDTKTTPKKPLRQKEEYVDLSRAPVQGDPFKIADLCADQLWKTHGRGSPETTAPRQKTDD